MTSSVLVVDDDGAFRDLAARMLTAIGVSVTAEASTFAEAIATANELKPHAALVDVRLPDGDGVTLASKLAALPWRPRVVLTSSDADAASVDDVRRIGADAFIPKAELPNPVLGRLRPQTSSS